MARAGRVRGARAIFLALGVLLVGAGVGAEENAAPSKDRSGESARAARDDDNVRSPASDAGFLDAPPFPGRDITDAVRVDLRTLIMPEARIGNAHVTLLRPQFGLRVSLPVTERIGMRVSGRVSTSRYRLRGGPTNLSPFLDDALDLHAARLALEGSYWLKDVGPFWAEEEIWSVLGSISAGSRWEDGDFDSGLGATSALGFGYEVPDVFRLGLGVTATSSLEEGGLDFSPFVSLRWYVTERFTIRSQGLGARLEYDLTPVIELHAAAGRVNDGFRLQDRFGLNDDLTFRDRYLRFSGGFEWDLANWLKFNVEGGYTAERRLRIRGDDLGTIASKRVHPSFFVDVALDIRF